MERARHAGDPGLLRTFVGDGRPLLYVTAVSLIFSGGFALFLSAERQFLPHDLAALGMTADELCEIAGCRVVDFMIHDRVAWGGTLIAVGFMYLWLIAYPLSAGQGWAWWALLLSGGTGFASFLGYLGSGYLDSWHGVGTLLLIPVFAVGLALTRPRGAGTGIASLARPGVPFGLGSRVEAARSVMLLAALAMTVGGLSILWIGVTRVFVPQDLVFMGTTEEALRAVHPTLVPLMAHDRIGFGGGVAATGLTAALCLWCSPLHPSLWKSLAIAWFSVTACAVGIHFLVSYDDGVHLAPAALGAAVFGTGLAMSAGPVLRARQRAGAA